MQELADHIWENGRFHEVASQAHRTWLARELGQPPDKDFSQENMVKLMQAAAILACSTDPKHRRQAYRSATTAYEMVGCASLPMQQALRVVLSRLGNFPALETREDVGNSAGDLPLDLVVEEIGHADQRRVMLREKAVLLTSFQHELWNRLGTGQSLAVAAPTSAGKSFVLQGHLARFFEDGGERSVIYLVPSRALIAQVARDLAGIFRGSLSAPDIITVPLDGDQQLPKRSIFVMTQERVQLMLMSHSTMCADVVIVDEAHSIADRGRGILLQWVVDDLLFRNNSVQLLFASPGIRNLDVFGRTFGLTNVMPLPSKEQTVDQNFLIVRVMSPKLGRIEVSSIEPGGREHLVSKIEIGQTLASKKDRLVQISAFLGREMPSIVYANGAAEAEDLALQLAEIFSTRETSDRREAVAQLAAQSVHSSYVLAHCVRRGVAFHYSNMPTQVRQAVEDAFSDGTVDFLVCTSTLLQGVNLPARNVFMSKPEKGKGRPLEGTDFWNLAGRAGRLRRDFQGNIFLIDYDDWKSRPLDHDRDSDIVPALEAGISERLAELVATMRDDDPDERNGDGDLETLFVRLLDDHARGRLQATFARLTTAGVPEDATKQVGNALDVAAMALTLPVEVIRQSPNLSPHRQQSLHAALIEMIGDDMSKLARSFRRTRARPMRTTRTHRSSSFVTLICLDLLKLMGVTDTKRSWPPSGCGAIRCRRLSSDQLSITRTRNHAV